MKIYDKAAWHIDAGADITDTIERFSIMFDFLNSKKMLSDDGIEIFDLGIDSSISLHEGLLNPTGKIFADKYYDSTLNIPLSDLKNELSQLKA